MLINFDTEPVKVQILSLLHKTLLKCIFIFNEKQFLRVNLLQNHLARIL